ncbi:MAG: aldo/keto reductase [Lentisphaerae bacterium]|nr:MAG: aldo/keto reductase [Lentisphaerota bacterium]
MQDTREVSSIDPQTIPYHTTHRGARIPAIGFGTFGSDHVPADVMAQAVWDAIKIGYRHIDCASIYGNEAEIGEVLQRAFKEGLVKREELWITSKVWNDMHGEGDVLLSCAKTLKDLRLDYLDLYLIHWPFPNHHPVGCDIHSRCPNAKPYIHENYMKTWRQMERLVDAGLVRHIGTSNMTIPKLRLLLRDCRIKPACNEMELHPHFQQPELFNYVRENGIIPIGYCPLGSPNRPERDRTPDDTVDLEDPVLVEIARRHDLHPVQIALKWAVQRGQIPIPMSTKPNHIYSNIACLLTPPLSDEEMQALARIDRNNRLIKGHVFLWKENQTWEDLWDVNGEITPP